MLSNMEVKMTEQTDISSQPVYNIRSVSEKTGISPETMRAWERRYGFPNPYRNPKGYRLYSGDEIAALIWLRNQTDAGMTIGQAIKLLIQLRSSGQDPVAGEVVADQYPPEEVRSPEDLTSELTAALLAVNETRSKTLLTQAVAQHGIETAMLSIISPALIDIGDRWHNGEIPIAIEHFGTHLCRNFLIQQLDKLPSPSKEGRIITACAPGEWHEIGILMLTILLRGQGWHVTYLGANLSLDRLSETLAYLRPHLLLFSATSPHTAENLLELITVLDELTDPKPLIGLGGLAFLLDPTLTNRIPGTFFGPSGDEAVTQINQLLARIV
jgi:methanogenic corrinoid protein MtbC1